MTRVLSPIADAGPDQTICSSDVAPNAVNPINGTGHWIQVSGSGTIQNPNSAQTLVSGLQQGIHTFRWIVVNEPCASDSEEVTITVNQIISADAGCLLAVCSQTGVLNAQAVSGNAVGSWSAVTIGPNVENPADPSTNALNLVPGQNIFRWTVSVAGCAPSSDTVSIYRNIPVQAQAGANQVICATSGILAAVPPTTGSGIWTVLSGGGVLADPMTCRFICFQYANWDQ